MELNGIAAVKEKMSSADWVTPEMHSQEEMRVLENSYRTFVAAKKIDVAGCTAADVEEVEHSCLVARVVHSYLAVAGLGHPHGVAVVADGHTHKQLAAAGDVAFQWVSMDVVGAIAVVAVQRFFVADGAVVVLEQVVAAAACGSSKL